MLYYFIFLFLGIVIFSFGGLLFLQIELIWLPNTGKTSEDLWGSLGGSVEGSHRPLIFYEIVEDEENGWHRFY